MNLSVVIWWCGIALLALAGALLLPIAACAFAGDSPALNGYVLTMAICLFCGAGLLFVVHDVDRGSRRAGMREVVLLLIAWWVVAPIFAGLPFVFQGLAFHDAWFEATSALTTTGAWLDGEAARASTHGMIWRASLQWLGGLVSIATAAAIFIRPEFVGIAALTPPFASGENLSYLRSFQAALLTFLPVYAAAALFFSICLFVLNVPAGDAIVLALSFLSSGGFAPAETGLDGYSIAVLSICFMMMVISAVSFITVVYLVNAGRRTRAVRLRHDRETPVFLILVVILGSVFLLASGELDIAHLPPQLFNAASFMSTNGITLANQPALIPALVTAIIGGAAVSTAGGLKLLRWLATFERAGEEVWKLIHPKGVSGRSRTVNELGVWIHYISFTIILSVLVLTISIFGNSLELSVTTAVAAISNTGPLIALSPGEVSDYSHFHPALRLLLAAGMIIGRLEMVAVLALFNRFFWRQ